MALNKVDISMIEDVGGANNLVKLDANAKIPAGTGANLLNKPGPLTSASDPAIDSNKTLGTEWLNSTSGEMFICTDATAGANVWTNVGAGTGDIAPFGGVGSRGVFGGRHNSYLNTMDYVTIATPGNATDFGDFTISSKSRDAVSNKTRGVWGGGHSSNTTIDYITIATPGNATDFGDLTQGRSSMGPVNNGTRGAWGGGYAGGDVNTIDYITIATVGNATDFGDRTVIAYVIAGVSSSSRGVFGTGYKSSGGVNTNIIDYITIATVGNATDFGDLNTPLIRGSSGASDGSRGLFSSGYSDSPAGQQNVIVYITIATPGNSTDFGDLTETKNNTASCSDGTKGLCGGGQPSGFSNVIDYVTIATVGNAIDFGDLTVAGSEFGACSGD